MKKHEVHATAGILWYSGGAAKSKCGPWTSSIGVTWELVSNDLLNWKLQNEVH